VSREPREFAVFGFDTTHDALDAEALLEDMGIDVTPMPPPASLSARCGIALRLERAEEERARLYLGNAGIAIVGRTVIEDV